MICDRCMDLVLVFVLASWYMTGVWILHVKFKYIRDHRGRDRMVVGCTTTYAISTYHQWSCEFESRSLWDVHHTTLWYQVCQLLATGLLFSSGTPVSFTNKTERHDITEILLKEDSAFVIVFIYYYFNPAMKWCFNYLLKLHFWMKASLSWSWSYGSWIYNYLCNQCRLSPLKLWVEPGSGEVYSINIMW